MPCNIALVLQKIFNLCRKKATSIDRRLLCLDNASCLCTSLTRHRAWTARIVHGIQKIVKQHHVLPSLIAFVKNNVHPPSDVA